MDTEAKRPPKIGRISVRDIRINDFIKIKITQSVFGIDSELNFDLILGGDFRFGPPKTFGG